MKAPEEMAEEYAESIQIYDYNIIEIGDRALLRKGFLAGYKAAQVIVEEELQAVQVQRAESPGLGAAEYALKNVLAKMGEV
jgi:hypothetical protein